MREEVTMPESIDASSKQRKAILIGLDGATFSLLGPWMEDGSLPNLKRIADEGTSGTLLSTVPPTTPPAWTTCVTGKNPGKHGIFDFRESPLLHPDRPLVKSSSVKAHKLWHILNKEGRKTGIMNVPITFPPEEVDGFMISGMMTPSPEVTYTYPADLADRLVKAVGDYVINIDIPRYDVELEADLVNFLADIRYSFAKRRDAFLHLMETEAWDLFFVVFIAMDRIQHLLWKFLDPDERHYDTERGRFVRKKVLECFIDMDGLFAHLIDKVDAHTDLLVVSDHGFGATHHWFNVNGWLYREGLLSVDAGVMRKKKLFYKAMLLNESRALKAMIPDAIQGAVRRKIRAGRSTFTSAKTDVESVIDWPGTKAFFASIPAQGIFINVKRAGAEGAVEPGEEYESLRAHIKERLLTLTHPETGERLVDEVIYREEVYSGPQTRFAPDILFVSRNYGVLGRQLFGDSKPVRSSLAVPNGFHRPDGIFMALGDRFKKGHRIEGARIVDMTPTILYAMGHALPDDMDGRVLTDAFDDGVLAADPVRTRPADPFIDSSEDEDYSEEDDAKIRESLKALGYIE